MNIFYRINCEEVISIAEKLSYLGEDISNSFKKAIYYIENLGDANRWKGNSYNAEIREINSYLDSINDIIAQTVVTIPKSIVTAVNNYAKADTGKVYSARINLPFSITELDIISSDKIVFYEDDIKNAVQQFSSALKDVGTYLQEYKKMFASCGVLAWSGLAMDEYNQKIDTITSNSNEIVDEMNYLTTCNMNSAIEKLSMAESQNKTITLTDGGVSAVESQIDTGVNKEFYDKFLKEKTDGSIAEIIKEQFKNDDKSTDIYSMNELHTISDMYKDGEKTSTVDCSSYVGFVLYNYYIANGMEDKLEVLKNYRSTRSGTDEPYGQITSSQYRSMGEYDKANNTTTLKDLGLEEIDYTDDSILQEGDILVSSHHVEIYAGEVYDKTKKENVKMVYSFGHDEDQYVVMSEKDVLAQNDSNYNEKKGNETKILRLVE